VIRQQPSDATIESSATTGTFVESEQEQVLTSRNLSAPHSLVISVLADSAIDQLDTERWWKDTENVKPL
jgi:hypothetical protein